MSVTNHQRLTQFFWATTQWRAGLYVLARALRGQDDDCRNLENKAGAALVDGWVAQLDRIVGRVVVDTNYSDLEWLTFAKHASFHSLFNSPAGLANLTLNETGAQAQFRYAPDYGSLRYWQGMSFTALAKKLTTGKFSQQYYDEMVTCGMWWDQFRYVDTVMYAVDRYKDDLLANVRNDLLQLIGEMVACRLYLQSYESMTNTTDVTTATMVERALLCKYEVLMHLLVDAEKQTFPLQPHAKMTPAARKKRKQQADELFTGDFDVYPLIDQVGKMSLAEVESFLHRRTRKDYEQTEQRYSDDDEKTYTYSGLLGPYARTQTELDRILNTTTDAQEYESAYRERLYVYNTFGGHGDTWAEVLTTLPRAAKVGIQKASEEQREKQTRKKRKRREN